MANLAEFFDPYTYDAEYGRDISDLKFYLQGKSSGLALDLACGTGRLTIPLATAGFTCIGLDASPSMLKRAKEKSQALAISYINGDMKDFTFNERFDLITCAGNSFQALLSEAEQLAMLTCVKKHLKPDGIFVFSTRNPAAINLTTTADFEYWHEFIDLAGNTVKVFGKQTYANRIMRYTTKRVWPSHETICDITLLFTPLAELTALLTNLGFKISNIAGYDEAKPLAENEMIFIYVTAN
jgi:2-polyprenyl-3-methyl-5-hydroxy-6-metoxy-1,4-benzoquinol methylase